MSVDPAAIESFKTLLFGIAAAGLLATGFEALTQNRASFHLLGAGGPMAVASVPLVVLCAPFIILRNTVRGRKIEGRPMPFVMLATAIACGWSLLSGRVALDLAAMLVGA